MSVLTMFRNNRPQQSHSTEGSYSPSSRRQAIGVCVAHVIGPRNGQYAGGQEVMSSAGRDIDRRRVMLKGIVQAQASEGSQPQHLAAPPTMAH